MSVKLRRILLALVSLLILLSIIFAIIGYRLPRRSFPQVKGTVSLPGLQAAVDIYRDAFGVPHIYASSLHDLFYAQGYVHAQDRFWQMDFWRHIGSARLAELFGESQLETDIFLRTLGWGRVAQQELEGLDDTSVTILEDYAEGVNAYLADHQGAALSLEYAVLKLTNSRYKPEPWTPVHTLTWAKAMAWNLGGNMDSETLRATLLKMLTPEQVAELYPPYPADKPVIVAEAGEGGLTGSDQPAGEAAALARLQPAFQGLQERLESLTALLGPAGAGVGSNNWVIAGSRTSTGMPLLANDPHLPAQMPSIWYEVGLHCTPKGAACPYEVTGFSFAGAPGVVIGHNDRIAWGMTNVGPDVQDLYIEKINPANPNQYEVNGKWVDMETVNEVIQVAGGDPVQLTVRSTRHGPVIWDDAEAMEEFKAEAGIELPEHFAISLRWTALDETQTFPALWKLNLAQDWEDFRQALSEFDVPSQNFVYADVDGNIGYQTPGKIPIRAGGDGSLPVPGWTDEYEWTGFIPFEELPSSYNPPQGYIVTANNAVVGPEYPYLITSEWDHGYRAQRLVELIEEAPGPIDANYIQFMQGDNDNLNAKTLVPLLMQLALEDERLEKARGLLEGWDYQNHMDSAPAALFEAFWRHLLADIFHDDLPEEAWPEGGSRWFVVVSRLVEQRASPWWDNQATSTVETREDILRQAFSEAVEELEASLGENPNRWDWGDLHTLTLRNQSLGESGIALIEGLFNRGPYKTSGGADIVNATAWNAAESEAELLYQVEWLPSMRMIVDLSDLAASYTIHTSGQSGHAYHRHYADMTDLWRQIKFHPMLWERERIEQVAEGHLRLEAGR